MLICRNAEGVGYKGLDLILVTFQYIDGFGCYHFCQMWAVASC